MREVNIIMGIVKKTITNEELTNKLTIFLTNINPEFLKQLEVPKNIHQTKPDNVIVEWYNGDNYVSFDITSDDAKIDTNLSYQNYYNPFQI